MSAETYGARLLEEIQQESLASLLATFRARCNPRPQSHTGLLQLDKIVNTFRYPVPQTTSHLLNTPVFHLPSDLPPSNDAHQDPADADLDGHEQAHDVLSSSPPTGSHTEALKPVTIHIHTTSASSKIAINALIQHLLARAVLAQEHGGQNATAVYIDLTHNFSATTLHRACLWQIKNHPSNMSTNREEIESMARTVLQHVHVLTATSTSSVLRVLRRLPLYLLDRSAHHSADRPLTLVVINGLDAFYSQDRLAADLSRLENTGTHRERDHHTSPLTLTRQIISALTTLQARFDCVAIYTTSTTDFSSSSSTSTGEIEPTNRAATDPSTTTTTAAAAAAAAALFTLRATRTTIPQFAPQMSLHECLHDQHKRLDALRAGKWWFQAVSPARSDERRNGFCVCLRGGTGGDGGGIVVE